MIKLEKIVSKKDNLKKNIQKNQKNNKEKNTVFYEGFDKGVEESFKIFTESFKEYKKYKNNVKLLLNEQKPIWKNWVDYFESKSNIDKENYLIVYNEWLLDFIFSELDESLENMVLNL